MEDVIALEVMLRGGARRYFMTWGRVFDPVDPTSLVEAARPHLGEEVERVRVCDSLQEASGELYFFEALFTFGQNTIPRSDDHESWRERMRERIETGHELYLLGHRDPP